MTRRIFPLTALFALSSCSIAAAQQTVPSFVLLGKVWAIAYIIIVLCVALGIAAVGRPTSRKEMKIREK